MSNRRVLLLLILGIVLAVVALVTGRSSNEVVQVSGQEVLQGIFDATDICLERAGALRIRMEKSDRWQLKEPFAAIADEARVRKLLDDFAEVPVLDYLSEEELQRQSRTLADFVLDRPVLSATFRQSERILKVSIGGPTPAADGVYARIGEIPGVFVVRSEILGSADLTVDELRRRSLFLIGPESVAAFDLRHGSLSRLGFVRDDKGWQLNGERASEAKVRSFLELITAAKARSFVWPVGATNEAMEVSAALLAGYGLDPESALTVTLKGGDGRDRVISLGKNAADEQVYCLVQNGSSIVTVDSALKAAAGADAYRFTDSRLFPVTASTVASFTVKDRETIYVLARRGANEWWLESPVSAPADAEQVEALLNKILNLSPSDADAEGLAVSLSTNAPVVSVARNRLVGALGFDALRSREVLRIDPAQVKRLVRNDGKAKPVSVVYARERQAWNLEQSEGDGRADESAIAGILSALSPLVADRVERLKVSSTDLDDYGLNAPILTLSIDQEGNDSVRRNLIVGGRTEGGRFATLGSADAVFVLGDSAVERISEMPVKCK